MKSDSAVYGFADGWRQAQAVAAAVGVPCYHIGCHHFPDGESRVRIAPLVERPIVFRSLYRPNEKLIELGAFWIMPNGTPTVG